MYNKMCNFPLVVVKDGVPAKLQIDDSRTEMVSPIKDRWAKRKQDLDDVKVFRENDAKNKKWWHCVRMSFNSQRKTMHHPKIRIQTDPKVVSKSWCWEDIWKWCI